MGASGFTKKTSLAIMLERERSWLTLEVRARGPLPRQSTDRQERREHDVRVRVKSGGLVDDPGPPYAPLLFVVPQWGRVCRDESRVSRGLGTASDLRD